jgi:Ca-activated chloride channel family protein
MEKRNRRTLVLGIALLMVGTSFAATISGADEEVLAPDVMKSLSDDEIYFGTGVKETTVTITVTGDGGTETTITPMDVVFAIDSSGSMSWNDPDNLRRTAATNFVDNMTSVRDTAGVVSWDDGVDFTFGLSDDFDDTDGVKYWINQVDASGGTNLNVGLWEAIDMLDNNPRSNESVEVIIFLTDGQGTYTPSGYSGSPADDASDKGYVIYSIGLGAASSGPLIDMAAATNGLYYNSPNATNLQEVYDEIYDEIVTSNIPHYVDVTEVTQSYIIGHTNFNIAPDSVTTAMDGTTTIVWTDVGQYVGDYDSALDADETVVLTFDVRSAIYGMDLPVQVEDEAIVEYYDVDMNYVGSVDIPQAYLDVYPYVSELIAGGGNVNSAIDVGQVIVYNDMDYLYIKYVTEDGWYMTETHLHVADDATDIPQTKKGNPIPGQFDNVDYHNPGVQVFEYTIPWDDSWVPGTVLSIAAHAVVQKVMGYDSEGMPIYQVETAWADGMDFDGKNWATYFEYEDP